MLFRTNLSQQNRRAHNEKKFAWYGVRKLPNRGPYMYKCCRNGSDLYCPMLSHLVFNAVEPQEQETVWRDVTKENKILVTLKQRLELLECPMRTVGPECVHKCRGKCLGDVECNRSTGKCNTGCDSWYTGEFCETGLIKSNVDCNMRLSWQQDVLLWFKHSWYTI